MNQKLLKKIVAYIKANPEHWNQGSWHCGTSHCVAGFAELDAVGYSLGTKAFTDKIDKLRWFHPKKIAAGARKRFWKFLRARIDSGKGTSTYSIGQEHLRLTQEEANYLFDGTRSLDQISEVARTGKFPAQIYEGK